MPGPRPLSDPELIDASRHLRQAALRGSSNALIEARRHEAELRRRFLEAKRENWGTSEKPVQKQTESSQQTQFATLTTAAEKYIIATADMATQSAEALRDLLHNLRVILQMDIAFVAEFIDGKKVYRHLDHAEDSKVTVKPGASAPLETTLCQRVVDGRSPQIMQDARSEASLVNLAAVKTMDIGAYLSTPVVLRDGTVYGTLCCISHAPCTALGSRQLDSLRYVAGIVATELEKSRG